MQTRKIKAEVEVTEKKSEVKAVCDIWKSSNHEPIGYIG
jgi:hypothetical protein